MTKFGDRTTIPKMTQLNPWGVKARRKRLVLEPWPQAWEATLVEAAHFSLLNAEKRTQWRRLIQVLIDEKNWEGCDGLEITDQVKVTVASQAALMILAMSDHYFSSVRSIVVFPTQFEIPQEEWQEKPEVVLGQAAPDAVLLAWDRALAESRNLSTGRSLIIHEFAHHLDFEDGYTNGRPRLSDRGQCAQWRKVMSDAFAQLSGNLYVCGDALFGSNAAINATEFFSEASERFFTVPLSLRHFYPSVYEALEKYYRIKTVEWFEGR